MRIVQDPIVYLGKLQVDDNQEKMKIDSRNICFMYH